MKILQKKKVVTIDIPKYLQHQPNKSREKREISQKQENPL